MKNYIFTLAHAGSSPTSLELTHSPIGWDEKTLTWSRNETYHSVMRSYSLSLKFIREAKTYIDAAYVADGINALITITVTQLDKSDMTYDAFYTGILDMVNLKRLRDTTECPIIDSDRLSKFKSRDEVELSLNTLKTLDGATITDFSGGLTKGVTIEGVEIREQIYATFVAASVDAPNDNDVTAEIIQIEEIDWQTSTRDYLNESGGNEEIEYSGTCTLNWNIDFPAGVTSCQMNIFINQNGVNQGIVSKILYSTTAHNDTGSFTDTFDNPGFTLPDAGYLGRMTIVITSSAGVTGEASGTAGSLQIFKVTDAYTDTKPELLLPDEAIQRALEQMTGAKPFQSDLVGRTDSDNHTYSSDGDLSMIALGNGLNLRLFEQYQRPFKVSFKDLFKALYSIQPIGFWYSDANSRWELEKITEFYKDTGVFALGEAKDLEISVDESYYFNTVKASYNGKLEYEDINANQNFATNTGYSNSVQRVQNEYNAQTGFRTDDYGIEILRKLSLPRNYSTDSKADDDNFMIYCQRDGATDFITWQGYDNFTDIEVKASTGQNAIYSPATRLNLDLSPKRCMLRHRQMLEIPEWKTEADNNFISSQLNLDLGLKKSGEAAIIYESDPISFALEPLYYPEVYNFTLKITQAIIDQLESDPHVYFSFTNLGTTYYGHIIEISTEPFNRKGNCTLIRHNSNR